MAMRMLPVDTRTFTYMRFTGVEPKLDQEGNPKLDRDNRRQFVVQLAVHVEGERGDMIAVTVSSKDGKIPCDGLDAFEPVAIAGLRVGAYATANGAAFYFQAESIAASTSIVSTKGRRDE